MTNVSTARVGPLYAAGFVTAFGAHGVATVLGAQSLPDGVSVLSLGFLLAIYDIAEVILKPVFGTLSDRIGVKPVIVGGLVAFALISLVGALIPGIVALAFVRLGQGAAAAAFSPASSAAVARLAGPGAAGRFFGRYGSWKSLGYALGPLIGSALTLIGGFPLLFAVLAICATSAAIWVASAIRPIAILPRKRSTIADLAREIVHPDFLLPVAALGLAAGALGVLVGFLPLVARTLDLNPIAGAGMVTIVAIASAAIQPAIGGWRDRGRISVRLGAATGSGLIALSLLGIALLPHLATLIVASALGGIGIGAVTALGFAHLASTTPAERLGRTMGTAELGRELGDAGGPILVGSVAAVAGVAAGLGAMAGVAAMVGVTVGVLARNPRTTVGPEG